jgi:hypothetical protein
MGGLTNGTKGTAEDRLALFLRQVKEHRIAQWTVGYVAVAYGIQHASHTDQRSVQMGLDSQLRDSRAKGWPPAVPSHHRRRLRVQLSS